MNEEQEIMSLQPGNELDNRVANELMEGLLKNYSSEIQEAWKVVEKLEQSDWRIDILNSKRRKSVFAMKMVNGSPHTLNAKFGYPMDFNSIPEGICKATLLTLFVEKTGW
jgi:hypothetical protein